MKPVDDIRKYFKEARINTNENKDNDVFNTILDAANKNKSSAKPLSMWRIIMKSKITKLTAAVIFIAVIIGLHQFRISIDGTSIAWADVAERLQNVSSYKARARRVLTEVGEEEPIYQSDGFRYFSPDHGAMEKQYIDGELGMLNYGLFSEKLLIIALPQIKQYCRFDLNEEILSMIEYMNPANTDGMMKLFGSERCEKLGSREIDGVIVEGFEVKNVKVFSSIPRFLFQLENIDIRMWVNTETLLPVEVEMEGFIGKGVLTRFKDLIGKEVVYDIEYDVEIDESIFEPNIPDDYILIDPANMAEKAELVTLGILPFSAVMITCKRFKKKRWDKFNIAGSLSCRD